MKATIEELRDKFFEECVSENTGGYKVINYAPHDLFEWIKENIIQPEPQKDEEEITIFLEKEYHFQFRDLKTLKGISDYKVSGKRLMQYLHNAELSLNNK